MKKWEQRIPGRETKSLKRRGRVRQIPRGVTTKRGHVRGGKRVREGLAAMGGEGRVRGGRRRGVGQGGRGVEGRAVVGGNRVWQGRRRKSGTRVKTAVANRIDRRARGRKKQRGRLKASRLRFEATKPKRVLKRETELGGLVALQPNYGYRKLEERGECYTLALEKSERGVRKDERTVSEYPRFV